MLNAPPIRIMITTDCEIYNIVDTQPKIQIVRKSITPKQ
jgi:hypothetical protein